MGKFGVTTTRTSGKINLRLFLRVSDALLDNIPHGLSKRYCKIFPSPNLEGVEQRRRMACTWIAWP